MSGRDRLNDKVGSGRVSLHRVKKACGCTNQEGENVSHLVAWLPVCTNKTTLLASRFQSFVEIVTLSFASRCVVGVLSNLQAEVLVTRRVSSLVMLVQALLFLR